MPSASLTSPSLLTQCHIPHSVAIATSLPGRGESFLKVGGFGSSRSVHGFAKGSPFGRAGAQRLRGSSGAVIAVDLDVIVGQIAAPCLGGCIAGAHVHLDQDIMLGQHLGGLLLAVGVVGGVLADVDLTCPLAA